MKLSRDELTRIFNAVDRTGVQEFELIQETNGIGPTTYVKIKTDVGGIIGEFSIIVSDTDNW